MPPLPAFSIEPPRLRRYRSLRLSGIDCLRRCRTN